MNGLLDKEIIEQLYSSNTEAKRASVYRLLFDRRCDLLSELKKAATFEQNEKMAVFMVQVCLTLESFPRDHDFERSIIDVLQKENGITSIDKRMWKYLETYGSSQMFLAVLGTIGDGIPPNAQNFIEICLNHLDPEVRALACTKAIKSGRPTHFAYILNMITDGDIFVSKTAFSVINELPPVEMAIILDYALGSPDEWVLDNIAPFLPLIIDNNLRHIISKVQYHKHRLVAQKACEALKVIDSISLLSKRRAGDKSIEVDKEKPRENQKDAQKQETEKESKNLFFREQMEFKRQQKIEEEIQIEAIEKAMAKELSEVTSNEVVNFVAEIDAFSGDIDDRAVKDNTDSSIIEQRLEHNVDFGQEVVILDSIDTENSDLDITQIVSDDSDKFNPFIASDESDNSFTVESVLIEDNIAGGATDIHLSDIDVVDFINVAEEFDIQVVSNSDNDGLSLAHMNLEIDLESRHIILPLTAREIATKYPSFIVDPFLQLFVPTKHEIKLKLLTLTLDSLIAFLNLSYLQTCLFFAPESEALARSIIDCLKGNLIGSTALHCLHNFAISMKKATGNPVFFTYKLSEILSDSYDTNPMRLMSKLKDFLQEPVEPLDKTIPQAIDDIIEILNRVNSITDNILVMKAPKGAKKPFADLSGPIAKTLSSNKIPSLDLPSGEIAIISQDGSEALSMFPYFKYSQKKILFARPDIFERNILLERLEIPLDRFLE